MIHDLVKRGTMMAADNRQAIIRLAPLADVFAALDELVKPVAARRLAIGEARHCVLAADVCGPKRPTRAIALHDGWAVKADELLDAGGYAPVPLATRPVLVETGDELPAGADAVAALDIVTMRGQVAEAEGTVTPGDGVLTAGGDCDPSSPLCLTGSRVRATDLAVFAAAGIGQVAVRVPKIGIVAAREDLRLQPALQWIVGDCVAQGGDPVVMNGLDLDDALRRGDHDAVVIVGGTGGGGRDRSVQALARAGRVIVHGIGLAPGETAALGSIAAGPVLAVPGRLDAALAVWLVVGRRLLAKLAAARDEDIASGYTLTRKVASTVGLTEFIPVRRTGDAVEPLAAKFLSLSALAHADGYFLVPAESEGYAPGAKVAVKVWP